MSRTRRSIALPRAGAHGGDGAALAAALGIDPDAVLDLSQSLNPVAPDPVPVVARYLAEVGRYPDPGDATDALAAAMGVDPDRLLLTNGGAEAIALGRRRDGWLGDRAGVLPPPPGHGSALAVESLTTRPGCWPPPDDIAEVWDEAFFPLATGGWTRGDPGAVVVGSLTKLLACPGLRLGYVLGAPALIDDCRRRQPAWSVNSLAAAALPDLLDAVDLPAWSVAVAALRTQLVSELEAHGLPTRPSDANWVLVDRPGLRDLLAPEGIAVRDCSSFGMPAVTRIAVPDAEGLARLVQALDRIDLHREPEW